MAGCDANSAQFEAANNHSSLKILNDFAVQLISFLNETELAWYVAREVVGKLGFVDCVVYYVDVKRNLLCQVAATGEKNPRENEISEPLEIPVGEGVTGYVAATGKASIVENLASDERYIQDIQPALSEICVPIVSGDKVLGVIDCEDPRPGHFGQRHKELLMTVAALAGSKLALLEKDKFIRESERNYRAIVEDQSEMISRHAPDGTRTFVNESYCRHYGMSKEELFGQSAYDGMAADDLKRLKDLYRNLTPENPSSEFEIAVSTPSGEMNWQLWTKRAIFDEEGNITEYQAVGHDITDRKRIEQELETALNQANAANEAKSDFLANMSHELRTPLNSILGFSQMIKSEMFGAHSNPKYADYATAINVSGTHLLQIINDILDISRVEAGETPLEDTEINVNTATRECLAMVKDPAADAGVELRDELPAEAPSILADERHFKQVLLNLLSNGIKFTPSGGHVAVSSAVDEHNCVRLNVVDSGIGVDGNDIPKILEPFGQVASSQIRNHDGTGLGLPICNALMKLHGGSMIIESESGVGTDVTLKFPSNRTILA